MWEHDGSFSIEEKAEKYVNEILKKTPEFYLAGSQIEKLESIRNKWIKRLNG